MIRLTLSVARRLLNRLRTVIASPRFGPDAGGRAGPPEISAETPVRQLVRSGPNGTGRSFTRVFAASMRPPWHAHPDIPLGSLGWRMGEGEEYLISFRDWFGRQTPAERARYAATYPEPPAWHGFYARTGPNPVEGPSP